MGSPAAATLHAIRPSVEGLAIATDGLSGDSLADWISATLDQAAMVLSSPEQRDYQKQADVWEKSSALPIPERSNMSIAKNGCLVFDVSIGGHNLHYAVWMTVGEIRIGVKIANALMVNDIVRNRIVKSYDGNDCSRQVKTGQSTLFDWIFRDAFASFDTMIGAMRDPLMGAVIARRVGEILTHLYITTLSTIVEAHPSMLVYVEKNPGVTKRIRKAITFSGDRSYFEQFIQARGARLVNAPPDSDSGMYVAVVEVEESGSGFTRGTFRDSENGFAIHIREIDMLTR